MSMSNPSFRMKLTLVHANVLQYHSSIHFLQLHFKQFLFNGRLVSASTVHCTARYAFSSTCMYVYSTVYVNIRVLYTSNIPVLYVRTCMTCTVQYVSYSPVLYSVLYTKQYCTVHVTYSYNKYKIQPLIHLLTTGLSSSLSVVFIARMVLKLISKSSSIRR